MLYLDTSLLVSLIAAEPSTAPAQAWLGQQSSAMRYKLAHRYFDTSHAIVEQTVGSDLVQLLAATRSLLTTLDARG